MAKHTGSQNNENSDDPLSCSLTSQNIKKLFSASGDIVYRDFLIKNRPDWKAVIIYVDGMVNQKIINDNIACPLSVSSWFNGCVSFSHAFRLALNGALDTSDICAAPSIKEAISALLIGKTLLVFDKLESALILNTIGFEKRNISAATEEETYRSGKDSFVETFRVNTATLRKKIKSHHLCIEEMVIGKQSHTRIGIVYMQNICNSAFVKKIKTAVGQIDQDKALSIRDVYTNIVKEKFTPFPTVVVTEKPDACCMSLLEGKVAVLIDEVPYALVLPGVFSDIFQSASDYGYNFLVASLFRVIRYICFFVAILFPGFFIAVTSFHPEMIPYKLAISIAASRIGTPFDIYMEVLLMTLAFFILIQASLQISRTIGATISIVGGLVLGQAAITAGIVSPAVIVIIAIAAISSMAIPNKEANAAIWLFQLICTLLSIVLGVMGVVFSLLILFFMLAKLEPLGVPYLSPYTDANRMQFEDSIIHFPTSLIKQRPLYLQPKNKRRKR